MLVSLNAADFLRYLTWLIFGVLGFWLMVQALRRPTAVNIDIGLLFGGLAAAIVATALVQMGVIALSPGLKSAVTIFLVAMPFLLMRLMDDVVGVPQRLLGAAALLFALEAAAIALLPTEQLARIAVPFVLALVAVLGYVVFAGVQAVRRAQGITRRRLVAVTLGSLFLACNFGAGQLPISAADARSLVDIFGLAAGICYYIGFAPPVWLRRVWQEPEVRAYLVHSSSLPQLLDPATIVRELERRAAAALGAPHASIGLWDEGLQLLRFAAPEGQVDIRLDSDVPGAQAFRLQQALFSRDTTYAPGIVDQDKLRAMARAVLAAPISTQAHRLGVLTVYGPRAPIFADDDLALVKLLADHAALVLEGNSLNEAMARLRAREEAARLKEDFLSSASHDLKTPLTTLIMQAQLLDRRAMRSPDAPLDRGALQRIVTESERLRAMILGLLDAGETEWAQPAERYVLFDFAGLVREVVREAPSKHHTFHVDLPDQLVTRGDPAGLRRLVELLVKNAVLYSPNGGLISVTLGHENATARLTVSDQGIGIPAKDLPQLFDRFHRGSNVDDRRFPGLGLGLFTCRRIVEQHGGQIQVTSRLGEGSSFDVILPGVAVLEERVVGAYKRD